MMNNTKFNSDTCNFCPCTEPCVATKRKKTIPAFGSTVKQGAKEGFHPDLGGLPPESPAVGTYNPIFRPRKCLVTNWDLELESEEFSETMGGYPSQKYLSQKNLIKTGRGPGTHEIIRWPEKYSETYPSTLNEGVGFALEPRFRNHFKSNTPGPGYTPINIHDPYYFLDQKKFRKNCIPSFLFDTRPRFRETRINWSLPCNNYRIEEMFTVKETVKKVVGKRGPYDLFTGPRDDTTIKGYLAPPKRTNISNWPMKLPGEIEKLFHKSNYFKGKWTDCPRFPKKPVTRLALKDSSLCYKNPDDPGPGTYDVDVPLKPITRRKNYAFGICAEHARPETPFIIYPGPGHYRIQEKKCSGSKGLSWMFKSKVPRPFI